MRLQPTFATAMASAVMLVVVLTGCAQAQRRSDKAHALRYAELAAQPAPATWRPGALWTFTEVKRGGAIRHVMTVRLTNTRVQMLNGGEWFALDVVAMTPASPAAPRPVYGMRQPVYGINGRNLVIEFDNAFHSSEAYIGALDDSGFSGRARSAEFTYILGPAKWTFTDEGAVHGVPVAD